MLERLHVMIDLETLGRSSRAAIFAVGLCAFTDTDLLGGTGNLYIALDPDQQPLRERDTETVAWWGSQSPEAQAFLREAQMRGAHPTPAAKAIREYFAQLPPCKDLHVWGNGPDFDVVILADFLKQQVPWRFYGVQSLRTLRLMAPEVPRVQPTLAHNALSDAVAQAQWAVNMMKVLRERAPAADA